MNGTLGIIVNPFAPRIGRRDFLYTPRLVGFCASLPSRVPRPTEACQCGRIFWEYTLKNAYYFSHDSNARNDQKILEVRAKYGMTGYGIFWGLIEMLREANAYQLPTKYQSIAFGLGELEETVKQIVEGFGLFKIKNGMFWSESLKFRMKKYENVSKKRSEAGRLGGLSKSLAIAKQMPSIKIKENKVKETKDIPPIAPLKGGDVSQGFASFWEHYPKKKAKSPALKAWGRLCPSLELQSVLLAALKVQRETMDWKKDGGQFVPFPATWLNQKRWEDQVSGIPAYPILSEQEKAERFQKRDEELLLLAQKDLARRLEEKTKSLKSSV